MKAFCNSNITDLAFDLPQSSVGNLDVCNPELVYRSPKACPISAVSYFSTLLEPYSFMTGLVLVFNGLYLFVFGHVSTKRTTFAVTLLPFFCGFGFVFFNTFTAEPNKTGFNWFMMSLFGFFAIQAAYWLTYYKKFGFHVLSAVTSSLVSFLALSLSPVGATWITWTTIAFFFILFQFVAWKKRDFMKNFIGASVGSYYIARGISHWVGYLDQEYLIMWLIINDIAFDKWTYLYMSVVVVFIPVSMWLQWNIMITKYRMRWPDKQGIPLGQTIRDTTVYFIFGDFDEFLINRANDKATEQAKRETEVQSSKRSTVKPTPQLLNKQ